MKVESPASTTRPDELAYRLRQQRLLAEFGRMALQADDLKKLLQNATELCARGLEAPYCKALEYDPETNTLLLKGGFGWSPGEIGAARLGADLQSPAGYAFHTGESVLSNHLTEETRFSTPKLLRDYGIRRAVNVLIDRGGATQRSYGVLEVDSPDPGDFDVADVDFLSGCARILGVAMERLDSDVRLKTALETQALLTREMNHRVKNSLGVVGGLLRVNSNAISDPTAKAALVDAEARILTIAKVHDHLWKGANVSEVNLAHFLDDLCSQLTRTTDGLEIICRADDVIVGADKAIPAGLIVNELVTNAVKYAYEPGERGLIEVSLWEKDEMAGIRVRDEGKGLPDGFELKTARASFGMRVILSLVRQLDAEIRVEATEKGASFVLEFQALEIPRPN